jgi:AbrB family looped-hinge helix DNA binding protein
VELRIENKGRVTVPTRLFKALGLREGDLLELDAIGRAIVLKPRAVSVNETGGEDEDSGENNEGLQEDLLLR